MDSKPFWKLCVGKWSLIEFPGNWEELLGNIGQLSIGCGSCGKFYVYWCWLELFKDWDISRIEPNDLYESWDKFDDDVLE